METGATRILRRHVFQERRAGGLCRGPLASRETRRTHEVGVNLYYTFRQGETAWLYARLLKLFHERFRVSSFFVDPYQLGHENEEAIESGSFWFYYKLGFRPESPEVARLAERELPKIAADPGYRTRPATLRRLAAGPVVYECR